MRLITRVLIVSLQSRPKYVEAQRLFDFDRPCVPLNDLHLLSVSEIYSNADQTLLGRLQEDFRIERKAPQFSREKLADYFSMWANTSPDGGLIVMGIDDKGVFVGCKTLNQKTLNDLENTGYDLCRDARYDARHVWILNANGEQDFVLLFRIYYHETKVVEVHDGRAYFRRGDRKIELKGEEKRLLQVDKGQVALELEPCRIPYPEAFNTDAIKRFAIAVQKWKGITRNQSNTDILSNHKLGKMQDGMFVPNIACALLFAKDPRDVVPGSLVRFQRYDGTEAMTGANRNVVKDVFITGTVPDIIEAAAMVIDQQVREFSYLQDGKFIRVPEYPPDAWYEALVNACVHRSYDLKNMNIFIKMFDDRLVIESPGPFPPFVTPATIYEIHARRNYWLMDALQYLSLVKCENEGTRRMRDTMQAMGLPAPSFEQKEVGGAIVRVTLRNNIAGRKPWTSIEQQSSDAMHSSQSVASTGGVSVANEEPESLLPLPKYLQTMADALPQKVGPKRMTRMILALCHWRDLKANEIAAYCHRSASNLRETHLTNLLDDGLLVVTENKLSPHLRYRISLQGEKWLKEDGCQGLPPNQ